MRRLLLITLAALAALPATASAQLPSAPRGVEFKISLYGIQRYAMEGTEHEAGGLGNVCFDSRGTSATRSVVRFATTRPARATLTRLPLGVVGVTFRGGHDGEPDLPVKATFAHAGKQSGETFDCLDGIGWKPKPALPERNCTATLTNLGFGLRLQSGRLEASGVESLVVPIGDPFAGCPWGDQSRSLYGATQRIDTAALLRSEETEVVLRSRHTDRSENAAGASTTRRQTTIYVTFKRVR